MVSLSRMKWAAAFLFFFAIVPISVQANRLPADVRQGMQSVAPYGQGKLYRMFLVAYEAYLWTDAAVWSYQKPFALVLRYNFTIQKKDIVETSLREMKRSGFMDDSLLAAYRSELNRVLRSVAPGDTITGFYISATETRFYHNDTLTGKVLLNGFGKHFFDIWFSPATSEPKLRNALLKR